MNNIDIHKAQKQFCESVTVGFAKDFFVMGMLNGSVGNAYAFTPQHMKRLQQYLTHQVAEYEKVNGVIEAENWEPGIKSPLQKKDK